MERLKVSVGKTYNLGNYESLRLDVGLEIDRDGEITTKTFESAYDDIKNRLFRMEVDQDINKRRT